MSHTGQRPRRGRVLVVEDEDYVRASLAEILKERGYEVLEAPSVRDALALVPRSALDVVLTDLRLPGEDGLDLVKRARTIAADLPVVVLTGHGTIGSAVECLKSGASDYLLKPVDPAALELALERAIAGRALRREVQYWRTTVAPDTDPIGQSPAWRRALGMVDAAATTDSAVLLVGETGTGKELLARRLHQRSLRSGGPYVRVDCAAVPTPLWESEFFGHRKDSFPGAAADRDGRFQLADKGTLFLDEVSAMPAETQARLLRAIQDGEFQRLGDEQPTRVDVRILAATNADLRARVQEGRFRADLYFRLNVLEIPVPPLRERLDDVAALASAFAQEVCARLGRPAPVLDEATFARLRAYAWPGNVRELRSVIERALVLHPGSGLAALDLAPEPVGEPAGGPGGERAEQEGGPGSDLRLRANLNQLERRLLVEAHRRSNGVRREAARLLGIDPRNLAYYFRKHGLDPEELGD